MPQLAQSARGHLAVVVRAGAQQEVDDALNLKDPRAQDIVRRLALEADVVIENFRPGVLEKWGLGYEQLARQQPRDS